MSDVFPSNQQHQLVLFGTGPRPESLDVVIVEILSWLPVKSLLRFRCVCNAWRTLISESYFIKKHLTRTKIKCSFNLLVREKFVFRSIEYQALLNCLSHHEGAIPSRELDFPLMNNSPPFEFSCVQIIGTSNGLICLFLDRWVTSTIMIWNPCTKNFQLLPQPPVITKHLKYFGFGYDSTSDDYKVMLGGWNYDGDKFVVVFTLKTGSWRKLESLNKYFRMASNGYLVNEALHWVLYDQYEQHTLCPSRIGSFDLVEEKFYEIQFPYPLSPVEGSSLSAGVGILDSCLILYFKTRYGRAGCEFKMWVMKEYGAKESWREVINIPASILGDEHTCRTCISENGEVVLSLDLLGPLAIYNSKEKTSRIFLDNTGESLYETYIYVETLVSPITCSTMGATV